MRLASVAFIVASVFPAGAIAQTAVARLASTKTTIHEWLKADAPVGGRFDVVGAALKNGPGEGAWPLYVWVPPGASGGPVCVEMTTRDAAYNAEDVFDVPNVSAATWVELSFRTGFERTYRRASHDSFAVSARRGTCETAGNAYLAVAWGSPPTEPTQLVLAVQAGGEPESQALIEMGGTSMSVKCRLLQDARDTTAFDTICDVSNKIPAGQSARVRIKKCAMDECTIGETIRLER